jgi:hypothetical protein
MTTNLETEQPILTQFKKDWFFIWSARISLTVQIGLFALIFLNWSRLPPVVPLYYSLPWGEEQLAPKMALVVFVCAFSIFYLGNTLGAYFLLPRSKFLSHLLLSGATLVTLLTGITILEIVLLVT